MRGKLIIIFVLSLLLICTVSAATLYGTVYDSSLNKAYNAKVSIEGSSIFAVASDAKYSFDVSAGQYTIKAELENGVMLSSAESVSVGQDNIRHDIILFPSLEDELTDTTELDITEVYEDEPSIPLSWVGYMIAVILIMSVIYYTLKRLSKRIKKTEKKLEKEEKQIDKAIEKNEKKTEDVEISNKEVLKFIKKEGGRTTQKDIRKHFPYSEAKISLVITELEAAGKIKKIKKGRGNVIVLK